MSGAGRTRVFEGHRLRVRSSCGLATVTLTRRAEAAWVSDADLQKRLLVWARAEAERLGCVEIEIAAADASLGRFELLPVAGGCQMNRPPSPAKLRKAADRWTAKHPAGTPVRYWPGAREGEGRTGVTTSSGEVLGGHTAGVYVEGAGFVALTHVEALPASEPEQPASTLSRPLLASRSQLFAQLAALRTEARKAGRATLAGLCTLALDGDEWAKVEALSDQWAAEAMGQIRGER